MGDLKGDSRGSGTGKISAGPLPEKTLRALFESAPLAFVMVDQSGTIVMVNNEAEKLFGFDRRELMGHSVEELVPLSSREHHPGLRGNYFEAPEARRMGAGRDLYACRKDGSEFPVEIGLKPIRTDDGLFVLSAIADITERKGLESALLKAKEDLERRVEERTVELARQADELRAANEALLRSNMELQQFAYIASHDLQSPLRSISGFVQLLQAEYEGRIDEQADDWIRRTVDSIRRMQALIQDLLAYSRVDSRSHSRETIAFREVVDDALSLLEAPILESGARIVCGDLPTVVGERALLVQLVHNLIGNAVKYRADEPPFIRIEARRRGGKWLFSVKDNGIGIEAKYQQRIFEIFHRLHSQGEHPGTGIGLAICRRVVHRHGGRIWMRSEPGKGTVFCFTLPERQRPE